CKLEIGDIRVIGQPADVKDIQPLVGCLPRLPAIAGTVDTLFRPGEDHTLTSHDARNMLIWQSPRGLLPAIPGSLTNDHPLCSGDKKCLHVHSLSIENYTRQNNARLPGPGDGRILHCSFLFVLCLSEQLQNQGACETTDVRVGPRARASLTPQKDVMPRGRQQAFSLYPATSERVPLHSD